MAAAATPKRATIDNAPALGRLFAAAFLINPVFDWIASPGPRRARAPEQFFLWLMGGCAIPFGEFWMSRDGSACAA